MNYDTHNDTPVFGKRVPVEPEEIVEMSEKIREYGDDHETDNYRTKGQNDADFIKKRENYESVTIEEVWVEESRGGDVPTVYFILNGADKWYKASSPADAHSLHRLLTALNDSSTITDLIGQKFLIKKRYDYRSPGEPQEYLRWAVTDITNKSASRYEMVDKWIRKVKERNVAAGISLGFFALLALIGLVSPGHAMVLFFVGMVLFPIWMFIDITFDLRAIEHVVMNTLHLEETKDIDETRNDIDKTKTEIELESLVEDDDLESDIEESTRDENPELDSFESLDDLEDTAELETLEDI